MDKRLTSSSETIEYLSSLTWRYKHPKNWKGSWCPCNPMACSARFKVGSKNADIFVYNHASGGLKVVGGFLGGYDKIVEVDQLQSTVEDMLDQCAASMRNRKIEKRKLIQTSVERLHEVFGKDMVVKAIAANSKNTDSFSVRLSEDSKQWMIAKVRSNGDVIAGFGNFVEIDSKLADDFVGILKYSELRDKIRTV